MVACAPAIAMPPMRRWHWMKAYSARAAQASGHFHLVEIYNPSWDRAWARRIRNCTTMAGKSSANRSLSRGMLILRAFRPGSEALGNGEIAELTGLPRATVSRLTQTLVDEGFLEHDRARRAYKLGAAVLGLAFSMRNSSRVLRLAAPLMAEVAQRERINVGLAIADEDEMVYLESIRLSSRKSIRTVMPGQRIPMETTSLGRAWLSTLPEDRRAPLFARFEARHPRLWPSMQEEISQAIRGVHETGYCAASWLPNVLAVATPIILGENSVYALNASVTSEQAREQVVARLRKPLLDLASAIARAL